MHGLKLGEHTIIPIRAVPFASGGDISPLAIALAAGDWRQFDEREFGTRLTGYWLDRGAMPRPMLAAEFASIVEAIGRLASAGEPFDAQIVELPPGVFFYRRDLEGLLQEINGRRTQRPPYGPGLAPAQLSDWPHISDEHERMILEGFEPLLAITRGLPPTAGIRATRLAALERIMSDLAARAAKWGMTFDRSQMPGRAAHLVDLVRRSSIHFGSLTEEVVHKDYFRAAGIKFRAGRRASVDPIHPLYTLM